MKKFFSFTKYLWIGGIMGFLQQILGDLGTIKYQGQTILDFTEIMGGLSIYAAIILLVIKRDVPPKQQFKDLLLFFVGLDLFYYLYLFIVELIALMMGNPILSDPMNDNGFYFSKSTQEISDFIYWTSIGLASSVWAFVATKLRNMEKKVLYIIMLIPLFAVIALLLYGTASDTIMFFITGGEGIVLSEDGLRVFTSPSILGAITALISLIVCLYVYLKKPTVKKNNAEEA